MSFLSGLTSRRIGQIFAGLVVVIGAILVLSIRACSDDPPSTESSKGKSVSVAVDSTLSNSLIDKTLTKHVDSSFVPRVSAVPIDRTSTFWKMFIFFGIAVLIYLFVRRMWLTRLPAVPSGIFVAMFGVTILHWLVWSLAPIWWESFYQSRAFWPVNLGIAVGAWLTTIAASTGGKHINKVVWSVLGLATVIFLMAAWPSKKVVTPPSTAPVMSSAIDPALRIPLETAELIDSVFQNVPTDSVDLMKRIACVESDCGIQFEPGDSTQVRRGRANSHAVGVFQIMETLHADDCQREGHDIMTLEGNISCAYLLYKRNGVTDWEDSRRLWQNWETSSYPVLPTPSSTPPRVSTLNSPLEAMNDVAPKKCESGNVDVIAPAASDTTWSEKVFACGGRHLYWGDSQSKVEVVMRDNTGRVDTLRVGPESSWPAPKWVQVKSTSDEPVLYRFKRH